ncbi:MAG: NAD(P) transhydrogenase subunit alpha [Wenzhouxiangella sp.]
MSIRIGVSKESARGERRVALDPPTAAKLRGAGHEVILEPGAGAQAGHPDPVWAESASVAASSEAFADNLDVLLTVRRPTPERLAALPAGCVVIGQLEPYRDFEELKQAAQRGLRLVSMELVPRITRAQAMDVLSSQATVAGYQAVIIAADRSPRLFPMLTTAAGTLRPAKVVVIGAGVAGLQAIATARRLGAQVEAYDIRAAAREQVESLGAKMIDTGVDAESAGGYARELTDEERAAQAEALARHLSKADIVISTAAIPGRPAPKIITREMVEAMRPGSVIVDIAAETGGNCELTRLGESVDHGGVLIEGPGNLPSRAALHASEMYARNIQSLLALLINEQGELAINLEDEVVAGCLISHDGQIIHERFKDL